MFPFEHFILENGLRVVVHPVPGSRLATVNILYQAGSRDEQPQKTGLAHLLEHLMFGGSKHVPCYDVALQRVGGVNNAYTSPDVTSYYCTVPVANLETAFWLESDRMLSPTLHSQSLAVQRKVVLEEFKECCLNRPYGRIWHDLLALAYTQHPYRWPTIGQDLQHITQLTLADVRAFFRRFYAPNNAVMVVAGGTSVKEVKRLSQEWFGTIPSSHLGQRKLPQEPVQQAPRTRTVTADVPLAAIYKAYHTPGRGAHGYQDTALLATLLGVGKSSLLYQKLVEQTPHFNTIHAYTTASLDPGLLVIEGKLNPGVTLEQAEEALKACIAPIQAGAISTTALEKAKNQLEAKQLFEGMKIMERTQILAMATLLGDPARVYHELAALRRKTTQELCLVAQQVLTERNSSTIHVTPIA